jgi:hypothetical protein
MLVVVAQKAQAFVAKDDTAREYGLVPLPHFVELAGAQHEMGEFSRADGGLRHLPDQPRQTDHWLRHPGIDVPHASPSPSRRFARSALGADVPNDDLYVTRQHAVLINGTLVAAGNLFNGTPPRALRRVQTQTDPRYTLSASGLPLALRQTVGPTRFSQIQGPHAPIPFEKCRLDLGPFDPAEENPGAGVAGSSKRAQTKLENRRAIRYCASACGEGNVVRIAVSRRRNGISQGAAPSAKNDP